jgi:hypothetical protein
MKKYFLTAAVLILLTQLVCYSQTKENSGIESLFSDNFSVEHVTRPGMQMSQIQNQMAGMIGLSSGIYIDKSLYLGLSAYANITHTKINMGVFGVEIEQFYNPEKVAHIGYNIFAGIGAVKDYHSKNNLFDNFLNIFGTYYYFVQPSLKLEINFTSTAKFDIGVGYRFAAELDENSYEISKTQLTNKQLNNLTFFVNFKMLSFE